MSNTKQGLIPRIRTFLYGAAATPKVRSYGISTTPSSTAADTALTPEEYRWFRRDEIVRRCIIINAAYACLSAGFETVLEPTDTNLDEEQKTALVEKFSYVKTYVDQINKQVNLDNALFIAQVKRSIYGKSAFEIVKESAEGAPAWLLSLQSTKITPVLSTTWTLTGFTHTDAATIYKPEDVLYFVNLQLENDYEGLSDIEPVNPVCSARHNLLKNDFPEITKNLWSPFNLLKADTLGLSEDEENAFLEAARDALKAGKSMVFNRSVEGQTVALNINLAGLVQLMDKLEETIIRTFGTPRFLINKTPENRATAFVEFEGYVQGPIANIQRYFKRELEAQWYGALVKLALAANKYVGDVPVCIKHEWNKIRASDFLDMVNAANMLYGQGLGLLGEHPELLYDYLGLDKSVLETQPMPQKETPKTETQQEEETVTEDDAEA